MIIILDLDETVIHSVKIPDKSIYQKAINRGDAFEVQQYVALKRPFMEEFIHFLTHDSYYSIGVWSAGSYEYVHDVVRNIFPDHDLLEFVMTANDCDSVKDKPLEKVRDLYNQRYDENPFQY